MSFSIHEQIRSKLRDRLLALPEGTRFATEKELCAEFGVSRMTVNKVVSELSTAGYLRRERLKGSFVSRPAGERPLVKFLLPAPDDILSRQCGSERVRLLLAGAVAAASRLGGRIETVVASPTNSDRDFDVNALRSLNRDSMILLTGKWYKALFPMIADSSARAAICTERPEPDFPENWLYSQADVAGALELLLKRFHARGFRRIALVTGLHPDNPRVPAYRAAAKALKLPEIVIGIGLDARPPWPGIAGQLAARQCDAAICHGYGIFGMHGANIQRILGLPESFPISVLDYRGESNFLETPPEALSFDYRAMGEDTMRRLLRPRPGEERIQVYPAVSAAVFASQYQ